MAVIAAPAPPPERRLLGIGFRCLAATAFALMNLGLKTASNRGVDVPELVFWRSLAAFPIVALWALFGPGLGAVRTAKPMAHVTRTAVGLTSLTLTFGALAWLPIAEATTLAYSAPVVSTIMSVLVLGERVGSRRWLAVLVGFAGMVLVMRPGGGGALPAIGIALGVAAAFAQSGVMITVRSISRTENSFAIVFWFSLLSAVAMAPTMLVFGHAHDSATIAILVGAGMVGGLGQLAMTSSLRYAPVSVVVPFDYLQMLWAALIGWMIFAQPPASTMLAGAVLIAGSGIYTAYRERRHARNAAEAEVMPES